MSILIDDLSELQERISPFNNRIQPKDKGIVLSAMIELQRNQVSLAELHLANLKIESLESVIESTNRELMTTREFWRLCKVEISRLMAENEK